VLGRARSGADRRHTRTGARLMSRPADSFTPETLDPQQLVALLVRYLRGMWRYRWLAIATAWLVSLGGWFWVYTVPNAYQAYAKVFVETDRKSTRLNSSPTVIY